MTDTEGIKMLYISLITHHLHRWCTCPSAEDPGCEGGAPGMAAVAARMKRKETPPPPYEDPPSYSVAMQMQTFPRTTSYDSPQDYSFSNKVFIIS